MSDNERRAEHIDIERWTIKELMLIAGMLTTIVSTAAIAQYQIAENRVGIKELRDGLTAHLQWEMEHELAAKQKELDAKQREINELHKRGGK